MLKTEINENQEVNILKKIYLKKCITHNLAPSFDIISFLLPLENKNKSLILRKKGISDEIIIPLIDALIEFDFFEFIDLQNNELQNPIKLIELINKSKKLKFLDIRNNFFVLKSLESLQTPSKIRKITLEISPQKKICENKEKSKNPQSFGFLSERLNIESNKKFLKNLKKISELQKNSSSSKKKHDSIELKYKEKTQILKNQENEEENGSLMMTRMNWLIELKILFEELTQSNGVTLVSDLSNLIKERINDFILIDEEIYNSTHTELGLTPQDILSSLSSITKSNIIYDDVFNLIGKLTHKNQFFKPPLDKKQPIFERAEKTLKNQKSFSQIQKNADFIKIPQNNQSSCLIEDGESDKEGQILTKPLKTDNVRSSCEHIIETARFNKAEEEKTPLIQQNNEKSLKSSIFLKNQEFHNNNNSPLSFSMSAIKMTETPGSKTFTLSDFGGEFLNLKMEELNKSGIFVKMQKSSTCKSSSLTKIMNQGLSNEKKGIFKQKNENFDISNKNENFYKNEKYIKNKIFFENENFNKKENLVKNESFLKKPLKIENFDKVGKFMEKEEKIEKSFENNEKKPRVLNIDSKKLKDFIRLKTTRTPEKHTNLFEIKRNLFNESENENPQEKTIINRKFINKISNESNYNKIMNIDEKSPKNMFFEENATFFENFNKEKLVGFELDEAKYKELCKNPLILEKINIIKIAGFSSFPIDFLKRNIKTLRILNLSENNIKEIPIKLSIFSLEFINLERNYIKSLNFLENCVNLQEIHISFNKIKNVGNLMKLKELRIINISYNLIENFDALAMLSFNMKLKAIGLKGNPIESKRDFIYNIKRLLPGIQFDNIVKISSNFTRFGKIAFNSEQKKIEKKREKSLGNEIFAKNNDFDDELAYSNRENKKLLIIIPQIHRKIL